MASRRPLVRASGGNRQLPSGDTLDASVTGNAATATKLATARTLSWTGDVTGSTTYDGSGNSSAAVTLAASGVTAGTYGNVTVNAKGLVTAANLNPTFSTVTGVADKGALIASGTASGVQTGISLTIPAAGTDRKTFEYLAINDSNPRFTIRAINEAYSASHEFLAAYRSTSGYTIDRLCFSGLNVVMGSTTQQNSAYRLQVVGGVQTSGPSLLGTYTLATLPSASAYSGATIVVSNATRGWAWCRSNGTSWIDLYTQAAVA